MDNYGDDEIHYIILKPSELSSVTLPTKLRNGLVAKSNFFDSCYGMEFHSALCLNT